MTAKLKEKYVAPAIEVITMEVEGGVMAGSLGDVGDGGSAFSSSYSSRRSTGARSYNGASNSDLEDMINDILTIEQ